MTDRREEAERLLAAVKGRGTVKRLGAKVDDDPWLKDGIVANARARGVVLPDEAVTWPGQRLIREALGRSAAAQVRRNPIRRDEAFLCAHCGFDVPVGGRTARNHCPRCLRSLHVDVVPGDRAADCGGILDPTGLELRGPFAVIHFRCRRCGATCTNKVLESGSCSDDPAVIRNLSKGEVPP